MKLSGPEQVVLDLLVEHELCQLEPATEELLALHSPPGLDGDTKATLNQLVADGFVTKRHGGFYRLTRTGLAHAKRLDEVQSAAMRLLRYLATLTTVTNQHSITWAALTEKADVAEPDFFICVLIMRVLEVGELTSGTLHPKDATWRVTALPEQSPSSISALLGATREGMRVLGPSSSAPTEAADDYKLPSHDPSSRYKGLRAMPGYVALSAEFHGAKGWLKLALALLTIIPHFLPIKVKELSLELSIASGVYVWYHVSNFVIFIEVKQASAPDAALTRDASSFAKYHWYYDQIVHKLGYVVYGLIILTVALKIWTQYGTPPSAVRSIGHLIGLPA